MNETFYNFPCPVSFAFLSDAHNADPAPVLRSLQAHPPEMILISGDLVRGDRVGTDGLKMTESGNALALLRGCSGIAPTFVSMGNHEWALSATDLAAAAGTGVVLLDNSWTEFKGILIGGFSSAWFTSYEKERAVDFRIGYQSPKITGLLHRRKPLPETSWLDDFERQKGYKILLCHHPEYYPRYLRDRKIDLICSGHCHGGQWRYYSRFRKVWQGVYGPGQGFFPKLSSGIHDGRLIVSRGLSNTTIFPRICNPTEVIYNESAERKWENQKSEFRNQK